MGDDRNERAPAVLLLGAPMPPPYGGIAKYLQRAIPHLIDAGFRVHVVQPPSPDGPRPRSDEPRLAIESLSFPGVTRAVAFVARHLPSLWPIIARYLRPLARYPGFTARQLYVMIAWCLAAERAWRETAFDLVHAYDYPWAQGAAAVWAASRHGAKSVISTFGEVVPHRAELEQIDAVSSAFRGVSRFVLTRANRVASMTNHCRSQVGYLGLDPEKLTLIRLVVGMDAFHPGVDGAALRARYAPRGGPVLLFVGQLRPRKGPQLLLAAMPQVLAHFPTAQLLVVGPDHGYGGELREQTRQLGMAQAVTWVGPVPEDELPAFYSACDLFVFPTLTPIECLGLTFVQAMFAGKPVIATGIAGAPEVISHGEDGFLAAPTAEALGARIVEVLELPADCRAVLGARARRSALRQFDEGEALGDLPRLYRAVLSA